MEWEKYHLKLKKLTYLPVPITRSFCLLIFSELFSIETNLLNVRGIIFLKCFKDNQKKLLNYKKRPSPRSASDRGQLTGIYHNFLSLLRDYSFRLNKLFRFSTLLIIYILFTFYTF